MRFCLNFTILSIFLLISFKANALANPASVNCVKQGNKLILIKNTGICLFSDRSYCEEWAYFRGQCQAGQYQFPGRFNKKQLKSYCIVRVNNEVKVIRCKTNKQPAMIQ